jgi:NAD(P)H-quinone oxidoreductase subunit 5
MGIILIQFSRNYLDGDTRQGVFFSRLYVTLGATILLVTAGNLWQLTGAWIATSLVCINSSCFILTGRGHSMPPAKNSSVARISDACLLSAVLLLARECGTSDITQIHAAISPPSVMEQCSGMALAAVFVVCAAIFKSAILPFHGWLLEVMETPTPVSALLHAGLLNAGTFLVVRFGDIVYYLHRSPCTSHRHWGFTALFASTVMMTQSSIKVALAYSSAAHMGFMLMLCGFGAPGVAIMHLVAHSCYKAYAFLASGNAVTYAQQTAIVPSSPPPAPHIFAINMGLATAIYVGVATLFGIHIDQQFNELILGLLFIISITYLLIKGSVRTAPWALSIRAALLTVAVTCAVFAVELIAAGTPR